MMLARRVVLAVLGWMLVAIAGVGGVVAAPALAAGDANKSTYPNEALSSFSAYLPDCRAYEMVTPAYKQGYPVGISAIAVDGTHLVGSSLGVFADAKGIPATRLSIGSEYGFTRDAGRWQATALAPYNPQYLDTSDWLTVSADLSSTLWTIPSAPVGQDDYYVRSEAGEFTPVGPVTSPSHGPSVGPAPAGSGPEIGLIPFEGASNDLSHVLYSPKVSDKNVWPGDETAEGFRNLFEYTGLETHHRQW